MYIHSAGLQQGQFEICWIYIPVQCQPVQNNKFKERLKLRAGGQKIHVAVYGYILKFEDKKLVSDWLSLAVAKIKQCQW